MTLDLNNNDRLLLVVPHPDDESLASGGLIQKALSARAEIRVIFATNGENNPWPQRWIEKCWKIGAIDRQRWAITRRHEARQALKTLGFPGSGRFLNLPDQGVTDKLLHAERETLERLCFELEDWQPTLLVTPSPHDLHPDHNALSVLCQLALNRLGLTGRLRQLEYLVHSRRRESVPHRVELKLAGDEVLLKRQAILCHRTQMAISKRRFIRFARSVESYFEPATASRVAARDCISEAFLEKGALQMTIILPDRPCGGAFLWIVAESCSRGSVRWSLPFPGSSGKATLWDLTTGMPLRDATVRIKKRQAVVKIPVAPQQPFSRIFVKWKTQTLFFDNSGWREVALPQPPPASFRSTSPNHVLAIHG